MGLLDLLLKTEQFNSFSCGTGSATIFLKCQSWGLNDLNYCFVIGRSKLLKKITMMTISLEDTGFDLNVGFFMTENQHRRGTNNIDS